MTTPTVRQTENIPPVIAAEDRSDLPVEHSSLIRRLQSLKSALASCGVQALYLYGSYARGEADAYSDIDVFVDHGAGFSLLDLVRVQHLIESEFDVHADVTTRGSLGAIKDSAERDAVRVF